MNENLNNNITCSQCGTSNIPNTKFCIRCGNSLQTNSVETPNVSSTNMDQNVNFMATQAIDNPPQPSVNNLETNNLETQAAYDSVSSNTQNPNAVAGKLNYFQYITEAVLKPFNKFKKEEENLSDFKNVGILSLFVVGIMTIIGLFQTMLDEVRVTSFWTDEVSWMWENLKDIEYFKVIGQSLLTYLCVLLAISGIYFIASLVIKKEAKFVKLLGATVTAFIPFALASSMLAPLLSLIYSPLGICVSVVGGVYALLILLELINELIKIENENTRIYFHLVCLSVLIIGGGFIAYKLVLGSFASLF